MPALCHRGAFWLPGLSVVISGVLLCVVVGAGGCRAFRSHKVSDESIAAARQLSLKGMDAQQRGQWDRAETLFAAAIVRCPSDERAHFGYAEALWQRGARQQALAQMEEAARMSGNDPERLVRLGQMYREQGDLTRAGKIAEVAVVANGQLAAAWALRGQVLQAQGDSGGALMSYHRALSYEQPLPEVQLAIARIYAEEKRPQRALATLQSLAATYSPGQVPQDVLFQEGLALRALARHQDALGMLVQAAQVGEPSVELLCELARTQLQTRDAAAARLTLGAAYTRNPRHPACVSVARELDSVRPSVITAAAVGP